jgi:neutral trehalase
VADVKNIYKDLVNPVNSIYENGQQWDKPNVWAPNNWILHEVTSAKDGF